MAVVKIPKSGGVVELDHSYRERVHNYQLHTYMYGQTIEAPPGIQSATQGGETMADLVLSPSSSIISFGDLTIYRIGEESMAPSSALPIGATRVLSEMQPVLVDPAQSGSGLLNAVLALLAPPNPDEHERYDEEILDRPVTGFLVVYVLDSPLCSMLAVYHPHFTRTSIDIHNRKMTILSPNQGTLVGRTAIIGSFEWQEQ